MKALSFKCNMSTMDRVIRAVSGVGMLYYAHFLVSTMGSVLLYTIGIIFVLTATFAFCPLYNVVGFSTKSVEED